MNVAAPKYLEISIIGRSNLTKKFEISPELGLLEDGQEPAPNEWTMRIINSKDGDKRITWDADNFPSISAAKELFDKLIADGFVPYVVGDDGLTTKLVMDEFNPFAEEVVMKEEAKRKAPAKREVVMSPEHMLAGG